MSAFDQALDDVMGGSKPQAAGFDLDDALGDVMSEKQEQPAPLRDRVIAMAKNPLPRRLFEIAEQWRTKQGKGVGWVPGSVEKGNPELVDESGRTYAPSGSVRLQIESEVEKHKSALEELKKTGETVGPGNRAMAGLKFTPEGRLNWIKDRYKPENVFPIVGKDGGLETVVILEPGSDKPLLFDKPGFQLEDLAEWTGAAVETVPGMVGEAVGTVLGARSGAPGAAQAGGVALGGVGDALGSVTHQLISGALPGEDFPGATPKQEAAQRAAAVGTNVVGGAVGNLVLGPVVTKLLNTARPVKGVVGRHVAGGKQIIRETGEEITAREMAARSADLTKGTGVELTPGQASLSRRQIELEQALRQKQGSGDVMDAFDSRQIQASADFADKVIDGALGRKAGQIDVGDRVVQAYHGHIKRIWDEADRVAAEGFGKARASNQQVPVSELRKELAAIRAEETSPLATGPTTKLADWLKSKEKGLGDTVSITELQNMLSDWGRAASGTRTILDQIDKPTSKRISARLFGALRRDLDVAADQGVRRGPGEAPAIGMLPEGVEDAALALREARDAYRASMEMIDGARSATLDKVLRKADPDGRLGSEGFNPSDLRQTHSIAPELLSKSMSDRDVSTVVKTVDAMDPDAGKMLRRGALDKLLEDAAPGINTADGLAGAKYSPAKFASTVLGNQDRIRAIMGDGPAFVDLMRAAKIMQRQGATVGISGSQTARLQDIFGIMPVIATGGASAALAPAKTVEALSRFLSARSLAKIFTDPDQSRMFLQLVDPPKWMKTEAATRTITRLSASLAKDDAIFDEAQQ